MTVEERLAAVLDHGREDLEGRLPGGLWTGDSAGDFLTGLIAALRNADSGAFYERHGLPLEKALAAGQMDAEQLSHRLWMVTAALVPAVTEAEPPREPLFLTLVDRVYSLALTALHRNDEHVREQASQLDELKTTFMRLTTHELRGPVGNIRGFASMINAGDFGPTTPPVREASRQIIDCADLTLKLAEDLGEVAILEDGASVLRIRQQSLRDLVDAAVVSAQADAEAQGVSLAVAVDDCELCADPDRARTAITNLLSNAVRHAGAGTVTVTGGPEGAAARVSVRDQGPGIEAGELERVFDKYYRTERSRGLGGKGLGLGLYLVRRIAELHGGTVNLTSKLGRGTTATLLLPLVPPRLGLGTGAAQAKPIRNGAAHA